jgi:diguanylate cyclase (GGDEF)-like protein
MQTQLPCRLCGDVANAVAGADTVTSACHSILSALFTTLLTESVIFQIRGDVCTPLAGRVNRDLEKTWTEHLTTLRNAPPIGYIPNRDGSTATFASIGTLEARRIYLVVDGDLSGSEDVLESCAAVIALGLAATRRREQSRDNVSLLRRTYRLLLTLNRARTPEAVAKAAVAGLGNLVRAERVSIAAGDGKEAQLRILSARGAAGLSGLAVDAASGVIGHVHQSGRALIVDGGTDWPTPSHQRARYRTAAFAVLPLLHNRHPLGVLSVTDKKDRLPFSGAERMVLRALAPVVAATVRAAAREAEIEQLRYAATVDPVTGLHNRAYLDARLNEELGRGEREQRPLAVLMVDVDDLKPINDTRGHSAGDLVLKRIGEVIRSAVRVFDICARYGGDEFVVAMPNSDADSAFACAERIRTTTLHALDDAGLPPITLSVGITLSEPNDTAAAVLGRADRALYEAKANGKNVVRIIGAVAGSDAADGFATASAPGEIGPPPDLPYMLAADADPVRLDLYQERANQSRLGLLVVRDGHQAIRVMDQFGPPILLAVDMTARETKGGTLLGWFHGKDVPTAIVAFSRSRALRHYARTLQGSTSLSILPADAAPDDIRQILSRGAGAQPEGSLPAAAVPQAAAGGGAGQLLDTLAPQVLQLVDVDGVAIYLKNPAHAAARAAIWWKSAALMTHAHSYLPRIAEEVWRSGELMLVGAIGSTRFPASLPGDSGPAIVATPVLRDGRVIGALCAIADRPIDLGEHSLERFKQIGQLNGGEVAANGSAGIADAVEPKSVAPPAAEPPKQGPDPLEWQPALLERQRGEFEVARELARARREQRQLSVVLFDVSPKASVTIDPIDAAADTLVRVIRPSDLPIRWSGNELLLVLPGLAGAEARRVAERVRAAMAAGARNHIAVSGGVAQLEHNEHFGDVVQRARQRVLMALDQGHNRVS